MLVLAKYRLFRFRNSHSRWRLCSYWTTKYISGASDDDKPNHSDYSYINHRCLCTYRNYYSDNKNAKLNYILIIGHSLRFSPSTVFFRA